MVSELVKLKNVSYYYGRAQALKNIDLTVNRGDVLGLLGPNGAGKSTAMRIIAGILFATDGEVRVNGVDMRTAALKAKSEIGYLPDQPPLYMDFTVDEYLRFCARLRRIDRGAAGGVVEDVKARCGLEDMGRRVIARLSKGYQQRLGIAQAIIHRPALVVLDEPTVGLDPNQIIEIRKLIKSLSEDHGVLLSTHILQEVALICNRVNIIVSGSIVYDADMSEFKLRDNQHVFSASFDNAVSQSSLSALEGVKCVEARAENTFRIECAEFKPARDALLRESLSQGWGLSSLVPEVQTLEHVFVNLTHSDASRTTALKSMEAEA